MHDALKTFLVVVSALFPIVDPLSASPIFLGLTQHLLPATRNELSRRVAIEQLCFDGRRHGTAEAAPSQDIFPF